MDLLALLALLVVVFVVAGWMSTDFVAYVREEWRLIRAETWRDHIVNPDLVDKDRAALTWTKQRALAKRMRRQGRALLTGKPFTPEPTVLRRPR
jgi:hypothetical protein